MPNGFKAQLGGAEMSAPPTRAELAEIYREDDRLRAEREHEERLARLASPPVPHDDGGDALYAVPEPEAVCLDEDGEFTLPFSDRQADAIADVINALRTEWQADIERMQQRLLDMMVRMVVPAERAEETVYALRERVAMMEGRLERQFAEIAERRLKAVIGDDNVIDLPAGFIQRRTDVA